jgi:filamentous hemagglutinin family protein
VEDELMMTNRRRNALAFCSSLAIATALAAAPQAASAQSFQGSSTVVAGSASVSTGTNTTTINVNSPQAVINWTPFDTATNPGTPIIFQPAGTTAIFQSTADFAVLNRILPADASRPVQFNGAVISQIQSTLTNPGGTVYFYSPGGIIVGSTAVFDVGNLGLTTSDPLVSGGNFIGTSGSGAPQVTFTGSASDAAIQVQQGAQINALNTGSYVAAFAPSVFEYGTVTVNGQAAYVAGEAGTITFNPDGLFDIQVTTGTDGLNGGSENVALQVTGTTTGGASTGAGDNRRIYMVAVPKNQLITLAIASGASLGFDIAGAADVSGNAVILSAGHNITGGSIEAAPAGGTGGANLSISDYSGPSLPSGVDFTSAVTAQASRDLRLNVLASTNFASDATLSAIENAQVLASIATSPGGGLLTTGQLTVGGNLTISAERQAPIPGSSTDAGSARMILFGGASAEVSGNLSIQANAYAFSTAGGSTAGGDALLVVDSDPSLNPAVSSLEVGGDLIVRAQGFADGASTAMDATGGHAQISVDHASNAVVGGVTRVRSEGISRGDADATGGTSLLLVTAGSNFTTGALNVSADGANHSSGPFATVGLATGGAASIEVSGAGSTLTVETGNSSGNEDFGDFELLSAEAFAGASNAAGGVGGAAQGGTASFSVTSGATANLPVDPGAAGAIRMLARAYGGNTLANGGTGGTATGGSVHLNVNGGTLNSGNTLLPSSFAQGGSADPSLTGVANGGNAVGGTRNVTIINGAINGSFAGGGPGAGGGNGSLLGTGGDGIGGTATFFMDNATITATTDAFGIARVTSFAQNAGGSGAIGGSASGGTNNVTIQNDSAITLMPDGNGTGGVVNFDSFNSTPNVTGGGAVSSGDATAGTVNVTIANSQITAAQFNVFADAQTGSIGPSGSGGANVRTGNATGGTATLNLDGATIVADTMYVEALGDAGDSEASGAVDAGSGTGGQARIYASGAPSTITVNDLIVDASGSGGTNFGGPGDGGDGTGGYAVIHAFGGGQLTVNGSTSIAADGNGHSAQVQGRGGDGSSGFAEASAIGGSLTFSGDLDITAAAEGGDGLIAGNAGAQVQTDRPNALVYAQNGSVSVTGVTTVGSDSLGGAGFGGGKGGNAQGGFAVVNSDNSLAGSSSISLQDLVISANGEGGAGGIGVSGGVGGAGGDAAGGEVDAIAGAGNGSLTVAGQTFLNALAIGGTGGDGGGGATGGTGGAGGAAIGGLTLFGTLSRSDTGSVNAGSASFTNVLAYADATGGTGGVGGTGSSSSGNGGAGGEATAGTSLLLVRGSTVTTTGQVTLAADAFGGDGGGGATQGVGGDATVGGDGGVGVGVTSRLDHPEQRGFLDAADIFAAAEAAGGAGSVYGASIVADSPISIDVSNGDLSANLLTLYASGEPQTGVRPSFLSVANGTVDIADELSMSTPGDLSVSLDNSTVNTAYLYLEAGNFVLPEVRPATLGTFNVASGLQVYSDLDFLSYANFALPFDVSFDLAGSFLAGDLTIGGSIDLSVGNAITTGSVDATNVVFTADQAITTGAIDSDIGIYVVAGGAVSLGDLAAGGVSPGAGKIAIGAVSGVTTGAISSTGDLGIMTPGSIATGDLVGRDVLLLPGQNLTTGSIAALNGSQPSGSIYFGNFSMADSNINVFQQFRGQSGLLPIFQAPPVAIGGSATFTGAIEGASLTGAAQGPLSAQAITAGGFIALESGGLASVNGAWRSPDIELVSNDIAITSNGSLDALSSEGSVELASTNTAGVTIGDGAGSTGYTLDNSEFSRIKAGEIAVIGVDGPQATDMTIGNLSITGSQLYGDGGSVLFATGDRATETPGGILRIGGALNATGFTPSNEIDLLADSVEIEAIHGSLKVSDGSNNLGGLVYIDAAHIHVASDQILAKLRADPLYAGHVTDLNTPLPVARPDGVLNALGLELYPGQTLYVQNTGTAATPAGFLTTIDNTDVFAPEEPPVGGVEVVINGQFKTETGTVTGRAAFDMVKADAETEPEPFAGFSDASQLNGCTFLGATCTQTSTSDPVAAVSSEITMVTSATLDDSPDAPAANDADEGDDGSGDDDDSGNSGAAPITPPAPLINTRQLNPNIEVVEPVAGAGNPALLGSAVDEGITEGETP